MVNRSGMTKVLSGVLVFGGVAVMGAFLALAQVTTPPKDPVKPAAKPTAVEPMPASPATSPVAAPNTAPPNREAGREPTRDDANAGPIEPRRGIGWEFDANTTGGLVVAKVAQDSAAARAGLQAQDRIVSIDGRTFRNPRQLQAYLGGHYGRRVPIVIDRGGQQYTIQLTQDQPTGDAAWLGVFLQDNDDNPNAVPSQAGARVMNVYPSGPAARAGVRTGDVITQVNGAKVEGASDLIALVEEQKPGTKAELTMVRGDQARKLTVTLGSRDNFVFYGDDRNRREDARDERRFDDDDFGYIPQHAMQLEHDRRMAEQHERIETELRKLQEEVARLRAVIEKR